MAGTMADSCCVAELKEIIEKMVVDLSQSNTKITELDVKIKEQEGENIQFVRDLKEVNESNDETVDIDCLPNEIIVKFFSYLKQNKLGQIARVCRKWCALTKSPVLWKTVNVKFSFSDTSQIAVAKSLINQLPTCVTSIRLDFTEFSAHYRTVSKSDFEELCKKLLEKCPHLESLMLTNCEILDSLSSVINLCNQFLQNIKNLVFHHCIFGQHKFSSFNLKNIFQQKNQVLPASVDFGCSLKFEVFDLNYSVFEHSDVPHFSRMPSLQVLCLSDTSVKDSSFEDTSFLNQLRVLNVGFTCINSMTFQTICIHGYNLEELYICGVSLKDEDLNFNSSAFPYLKTICLSGACVSCECIVSIIKSCPSLQNIYVRQYVATCFAEHPFVAANRDKLGIVKAIDWFHIHKVNYLHN